MALHISHGSTDSQACYDNLISTLMLELILELDVLIWKSCVCTFFLGVWYHDRRSSLRSFLSVSWTTKVHQRHSGTWSLSHSNQWCSWTHVCPSSMQNIFFDCFTGFQDCWRRSSCSPQRIWVGRRWWILHFEVTFLCWYLTRKLWLLHRFLCFWCLCIEFDPRDLCKSIWLVEAYSAGLYPLFWFDVCPRCNCLLECCVILMGYLLPMMHMITTLLWNLQPLKLYFMPVLCLQHCLAVWSQSRLEVLVWAGPRILLTNIYSHFVSYLIFSKPTTAFSIKWLHHLKVWSHHRYHCSCSSPLVSSSHQLWNHVCFDLEDPNGFDQSSALDYITAVTAATVNTT